MTTKPWVHVALDRAGIESEIRRWLRPTGLFCLLDGSAIRGLDDFYVAIEQAVPLIEGFGRNLDALMDLIRTFGWGEHAGRSHCLIWRRPDVMMAASPSDFDIVSDILVGVSKGLLVGDELDPTFDPSNEEDWISTRLDLVFLPGSSDRINEIAKKVSHLSDGWADEFRVLDVPVEVDEE